MVTRLQKGNVKDRMILDECRRDSLYSTGLILFPIGNGTMNFLPSLWKLRLASDDCFGAVV